MPGLTIMFVRRMRQGRSMSFFIEYLLAQLQVTSTELHAVRSIC